MVFLLLFVAPGLAALVAEYLFCRIPKKRLWRALPPLVLALGAAVVVWSRVHSWSEGPIPIETLLFFPGVPVLGLALGLFLGWRLWHKLWDPRVVTDKRK